LSIEQWISIVAIPDAGASCVDKSGHDTLIVDGTGRIHGCTATMEDLFGTAQGQLVGRPISMFIAGILLEGSSPEDNVRQLTRLCAESDWRKFEAVDVLRRSFSVEIYVSRTITGGQEVFALSFR
jgi:hypothetical protein